MYGKDIERIIKKLEQLKDKTYEKMYKLCEDTSYRLNHLAIHDKIDEGNVGGSTNTPSGPDSGRWITIYKEAKKQLNDAYKQSTSKLYNSEDDLTIKIDGTSDDMILDCPGYVAGCISVFADNHIEKTIKDFMKADEEIIDAGFGMMPFPGWDQVQEADILVLKDKRVDIVNKVNGDTVSVYCFEKNEDAATKDPIDITKYKYEVLWRLTVKPPKVEPMEEYNCVPKEKPVSITDPMKAVLSKFNSLKGDIKKVLDIGSSLYIKKEEFNNSIGSPFKEFKQLQDVIEDAKTYAEENTPYKWLSQKTSMLAILNSIISYANDAKYAIITYNDYIQRGYDHKYNNNEPSITWRYSLDNDTTGNLEQDFDENVNIHKPKDYEIY